MSREHHSDYDAETTARCERALLTLLGDLGPWRARIYLVGGLAPRYLIERLPEGARGHVGTVDVDLVIGLALGDETPETYQTLQNNLERARFERQEPSFRWARDVEGVTVLVEFLCETDEVEPGRIFRPKGESTGSCAGRRARPEHVRRGRRGVPRRGAPLHGRGWLAHLHGLELRHVPAREPQGPSRASAR